MAKRMKTEYMKQFRGPSWEVYGSCYSALLEYRGMRRLLEQAHVPWIWDSASGSSSGSSTPTEPLPEDSPQTHGQGTAAEPPAAATETECLPEAGEKGKDEEPTADERRLRPEDCRRVSAKTPRSAAALGAPKETKAPFAMFGWAERDAEVGCKKTHNVSASALKGQIYESAVRAHHRRQVQKAMCTPHRRPSGKVTSTTHFRAGQCKSTLEHKSLSDHLQVRVLKPTGAEDPWLSEYMRCYSSRSL
ncbi:centriole, cilia and spindle-associated protein-like [Hemiscyllium ocellatum]|uniref:centriole, cilia and spindle-associated protein-like n=1 Tax=Hemiscyllium ocellatum TaxID=170820 RepID=UPI002965E2CD|nr:centriole, cilia and spindle-associated protein-like [Hemiscyllium ocellatum]